MKGQKKFEKSPHKKVKTSNGQAKEVSKKKPFDKKNKPFDKKNKPFDKKKNM